MSENINNVLSVGGTSDLLDPNDVIGKLGGWLILPAIGLILGCIITVIGVFVTLSNVSENGLFGLILLIQIIMAVFVFYATFRFFSRKRNAPKAMIALMIAGIVTSIILIAASAAAGEEEIAARCVLSLVKGVIGASIWIPYFCVSKRVKRTFVVP